MHHTTRRVISPLEHDILSIIITHYQRVLSPHLDQAEHPSVTLRLRHLSQPYFATSPPSPLAHRTVEFPATRGMRMLTVPGMNRGEIDTPLATKHPCRFSEISVIRRKLAWSTPPANHAACSGATPTTSCCFRWKESGWLGRQRRRRRRRRSAKTGAREEWREGGDWLRAKGKAQTPWQAQCRNWPSSFFLSFSCSLFCLDDARLHRGPGRCATCIVAFATRYGGALGQERVDEMRLRGVACGRRRCFCLAVGR